MLSRLEDMLLHSLNFNVLKINFNLLTNYLFKTQEMTNLILRYDNHDATSVRIRKRGTL